MEPFPLLLDPFPLLLLRVGDLKELDLDPLLIVGLFGDLQLLDDLDPLDELDPLDDDLDPLDDDLDPLDPSSQATDGALDGTTETDGDGVGALKQRSGSGNTEEPYD